MTSPRAVVQEQQHRALLQRTYLGEEFSLLRVFRWKREGAKQTARFVGVIWFSFTAAVTSLRK